MATRNAVSRALADADGPASVESLAEATGLRAPVVSLCLWQLEQMGLARCNHRGWVEATPRGASAHRALYELGSNGYKPKQAVAPDE